VLEAVLAGIPGAALEAAARAAGPAQQDELGLAGLLEAMLHHLLNLQVRPHALGLYRVCACQAVLWNQGCPRLVFNLGSSSKLHCQCSAASC
jgi:hypothetical protein